MTHAATLTVNLSAITRNYLAMQRLAGKAQVASVVKANSYGLGMADIAPALYRAGCRRFYVAHMEGGLTLKDLLPADASIAVLHGPSAETAITMAKAGLEATINTEDQWHWWAEAAQQTGTILEASLHVDTGMNRLGLDEASAAHYLSQNSTSQPISIRQIMSHLACADQPEHPHNAMQLAKICTLRQKFPHMPISFASSAGSFLGSAWHFDEIRTGAALYGLRLTPAMAEVIEPVARVSTPIIHIRPAHKGETVGYGGSYRMEQDGKLAIIPLGYADGLPRRLSNHGHIWLTDGQKHHLCPIVGRVSMDLTTLDVSACDDGFLARAQAEWFGPLTPIEKLAAEASTMSYEIFTQLGSRLKRSYIEDQHNSTKVQLSRDSLTT